METLWAIIVWIFFGLVVGALARLLKPGSDPMGLFSTMLLGIVGSLAGGGVWYLIQGGDNPYTPAGFLLALISAIVLLALGLFVKDSQTASD